MRYKLLLLLGFLVFFLFSPIPLLADDDYVECNSCGYCRSPDVPSPTPLPPPPVPNKTQEDCMRCLYGEDSLSNPVDETLLIDPTTGLPPQPIEGHMNTMLGCISTNSFIAGGGGAQGLAQLILNFIFKIAGAIAFLYIIYGAYIILTSQDNPEKLGKGKAILLGAIVGLAISLLSVFVLDMVANGILKVPEV